MPDGAYPNQFLTQADVQALMQAHGAREVSILEKPFCPPVVFFVHQGEPKAWILRPFMQPGLKPHHARNRALLGNFAADVARELGPIVRSN